MSEIYTPEEVADRFKITRQMVLDRVNSQMWPCLKLGGKTVRFTEAHLERIESLTEKETWQERNSVRRIGGRANF